MEDEQKSFIAKIIALSLLYQEVKKILILAENINEGRSLYLGPINELRNALDRVMRAFLSYTSNPKESHSEVSRIQEHLLRAGYDGYEIIATTLIQQIQESPIKEFKTEIVAKVFPEYYNKYKNELLEIKRELADVRNKGIPQLFILISENNNFKEYLIQIERLFEILDKINTKIPDIINFQRNLQHIDGLVGYVDKLSKEYDIDLLTKVIPDYSKLRQEFNQIKKQDASNYLERLNEIHNAISIQENDLKVHNKKKNNDWWRKEILIKILIGAIVGGVITYGIKSFLDKKTSSKSSIESKIDSTKVLPTKR